METEKNDEGQITKITVHGRKSKNYQAYEIVMENTWSNGTTEENAIEKGRRLQTVARKLCNEQIKLDSLPMKDKIGAAGLPQ